MPIFFSIVISFSAWEIAIAIDFATLCHSIIAASSRNADSSDLVSSNIAIFSSKLGFCTVIPPSQVDTENPLALQIQDVY